VSVETSGGNEEEKGLMGLLDESIGTIVVLDFFLCQNDELLSPIYVTCYRLVSGFCSDVINVVNFHYCRSSGIRKAAYLCLSSGFMPNLLSLRWYNLACQES
jgi:hypothetical protein